MPGWSSITSLRAPFPSSCRCARSASSSLSRGNTLCGSAPGAALTSSSATVNNLWGYDITRRMQYPVHDEELFMEEALAAIRQAITNEEVGETTLAPAERRTSGEQTGARPIPET